MDKPVNPLGPISRAPLPPGLDARSAAVLREIVEQYWRPASGGQPHPIAPAADDLSPATIPQRHGGPDGSGCCSPAHLGRSPADRPGPTLFVDGLLHFGDSPKTRERPSRPALAPQAAAWRTRWRRRARCFRACPRLRSGAGTKSEGAVRHIEFVPLGPVAPRRARELDGHVENRVIDTPPGLPPSALQQVEQLLMLVCQAARLANFADRGPTRWRRTDGNSTNCRLWWLRRARHLTGEGRAGS